MDQELTCDPNLYFYVASDSLSDKLDLKKQFGDRVIMSLKEAQRENVNGIIDALVELYILSRCKKIYGSSHSSFSILAAELGGVELEILSLRK